MTKGVSDLTVSTKSPSPLSSQGSALQQKSYNLFGDMEGRSTAPIQEYNESPIIGRSRSDALHEILGGPAGLIRSQSAAPSFHDVAPPPGWNSETPLARAKSTGPMKNAVRPAPKSLMDLIQEDSPENDAKRSSFAEEDTTTMGRSNLLPGQANSFDRQDVPQQLERQSQLHMPPQRTVVVSTQGFEHRAMNEYAPVSAPAPHSNIYVPQDQTVQHLNQQSIQVGQQPQIMLNQQSQQQYGAYQQPGLQQQGMHSTQMRLPAQVQMSGQMGGQTVFMQQQPSYGYTVQYSNAPQPAQPQIIHQSGDQYVSVMPMTAAGQQQVTYWQPNRMSPQAMNGMNPPMAHQHVDSAQYGMRKPGGGRGRRGQGRGRGGEAKHTVSCPLLEEFRASKSRDWTIRRIEGYVVQFCQDQNGSRFIQQRLEMGDVNEQMIVMKEVLPAIRSLRNNVFGNYVVQKLLDFGVPDVKADIRKTLEGEMLSLSLETYGCRVVQKALEALDEDDLPRLLREFHYNILSCIHDQNGNHVVQKCVEVMNSRANKAAQSGDLHRASFLREQIDFIIEDVLVNTTSLSCHPYGCRVLQRILEHCDDVKKTAVLDEVKKCHQTLLDDQYGNYVIQHVLQYGREEDRDSILQIVVENGLLSLARQKFASNVVEKLLKYGNGKQRRAVVREMLKVRALNAVFWRNCSWSSFS